MPTVVQRTSTLVLLLCLMSGFVASLHPSSVGATGHGATRYLSESWLSPVSPPSWGTRRSPTPWLRPTRRRTTSTGKPPKKR